ncbi:MAG: 4-hydroxythreonine-4-phosphate dehydrogenase PdxA [Saprospiraceae bacterium]
MEQSKIKIGISTGDINGVGLEVILKTLSDDRILEYCTPIIYSSSKVVSYHKNIAQVEGFSFNGTKNISQIKPKVVNVINCWQENVNIKIGTISEVGGQYALISLERAVQDLKAGHIDGLVTAPIHKKAMQLAGFEDVGHTEYITKAFDVKESLMLLVNDDLRVGLVTNHIPIRRVAQKVNTRLVLKKIEIMEKTLRVDFGINKPKIAVLGLNPHAGDDGLIGDEELKQIIPAVEQAKDKGIVAIGPYSADGFFGSGQYKAFDGILAMYHDQGLVAFKALSFGSGVNYTAGLPIVRTSPDHGTAFDIAGQNTADPSSFRKALFQAIDVVKNRRNYAEMHANPLRRKGAPVSQVDEDISNMPDDTNKSVL